MFIRNAISFATNGAQSGQSGTTQPFASVWLNAFGRVINNHEYCELLVMRN